MKRFNLAVKRLFDVIASGVAIVLLIPVWVIVPIAIKADSKGPVFFKQDRRTKDGRIFRMVKFRTMVVGAEQMGAGLFNYSNDSRVTKVGRFLRDTSLDELPQLFNIFTGDMSVVGPRPCVSYELGDFDTLNKRYKNRFRMKAGLTGLAQCKDRNGANWDQKVTYDNAYIDAFEKTGVWIDVKVLLMSVCKVFKKDDICETKVDDAMSDAESAKAAEEEIIRLAHLPDEEQANI